MGKKITRKALCREVLHFPQPWQGGGTLNERHSPTALKLKDEAPGAPRHGGEERRSSAVPGKEMLGGEVSHCLRTKAWL